VQIGAGLTLVCGPNGSGKSTLLEAVSWCLWGKTIRGESLIVDETRAASVRVVTDRLSVTRSRSAAGRTSLTWSTLDTAPLLYESTTHAQRALEEALGLTWDHWRRTCVFTTSRGTTSARSVSEFLDAPDSEKKALLERLCGLEQFDLGAERARDDLRAAQQGVHPIQSQLAAVAHAHQLAQQRYDLAHAAFDRVMSSAPSVPPHPGEPPMSDEEAHVLTMSLSMLETQLRVATDRSRRPRAPSTSCAACGRAFDNAADATAHHAAEVAAADAAGHEAAQLSDKLATDRGNAGVKLAALQRWKEALSAHTAAQRVAARYADSIQSATDELLAASAALELAPERRPDLEEQLREQERRVKVLEGCVQVLGAQGARGMLLSSMIESVSEAAQMWAHRLVSPEQVLQITSTSELKNGATSMKIGVNVAGPIAKYGAASQGEARRLDLAVMLALASFSTEESGTLWMDEVLDGLDVDGVDTVAGILVEVSQHRSIVVVTHSERLIMRLSGCSSVIRL